MSTSRTLTTRQRRAVAALLASGSVRQAAEVAGCARSSLYRWLREPEFAAALTDSQDEVLRLQAARLVSLLDKSLDVVAGGLEPGAGAVWRFRAAALLLRHFSELADYTSLVQRVARLEEKLR